MVNGSSAHFSLSTAIIDHRDSQTRSLFTIHHSPLTIDHSLEKIMQGVTVVDHPLVQHKLTIMRKKETSTAGFRRLLREISLLLGYEVTRTLELTTTTIETPTEEMDAPTLERQNMAF